MIKVTKINIKVEEIERSDKCQRMKDQTEFKRRAVSRPQAFVIVFLAHASTPKRSSLPRTPLVSKDLSTVRTPSARHTCHETSESVRKLIAIETLSNKFYRKSYE